MLLDQTLHFLTLAVWAACGLAAVLYLLIAVPRQGFFTAVRKLLFFRLPLALLLAATVLTVVSSSLIFVEPQKIAVVISLISPEGILDRPFRSGLRWIVPLLEDVRYYPVSWQTYTMSSKPDEGQHAGDDSIAARTSDGQEVWLDSSIIYRIDADQVIRLYIDWQDRYVEDYLRPVSRGLIRTLVSQYKADEVNSSRRKDLEAEIDREVRAALLDKGLILDRFILRNISFSPEYAASIELKQVALQQSIQSDYQAERVRKLAQGEADGALIRAQADSSAIRLKAQAEADGALARAKAQAEALRLINEALGGNEQLLTYQYIDKLSPNIRVMLVPNNAPLLLPLSEFAEEVVAPATSAPATSAPATPAPAAPAPTAPAPVTPEATPAAAEATATPAPGGTP